MTTPKQVYIVHVYSTIGHLAHVDQIIELNPDSILLWCDVEYEAEFIFKDFLAAMSDYLRANNKTITILYPGPDKKLNENVFLEKTYGYYLVNHEFTYQPNKDIDFSNVHLHADKLFTLYCNRGSPERFKIIDTFARENMISDGIVTFHGIHSNKPPQWQYHDGSPLIDESDFVLSATEDSQPSHFPKSFFRGLVDVVCESRVDNHEHFLTEKTAKSIIALKPFLALSSQYYCRYLRSEYGIEPYTEIFDYGFDSKADVNDRIEGIVKNIKRLYTIDKSEVHRILFDKMVHNKNQFIKYNSLRDKMIPPSLEFVFTEPYELLGDSYIINNWFNVLIENGWLPPEQKELLPKPGSNFHETLVLTEGDRLDFIRGACPELTEKNIIHIPPTLVLSHFSVNSSKQCVSYILSRLSKDPDAVVLFDWLSEGYIADPIEFMNTVIKELVENRGVSMESIIYINGAAPTQHNFDAYTELLNHFQHLAKTVVYSNTSEMLMSGSIPKYGRIVHSNHPHRAKKFICLNNGARPHRRALISQLYYKKLFDLGYVSAAGSGFYEPQNVLVHEVFPKLAEQYVIANSQMEHKFPINLTLRNDNSNLLELSDDDIELYKSSLFSLVTETLFYDDTAKMLEDEEYSTNMMSFPCTFLTEKIFKPIRAEHPFIVLSTKHFLKELRGLGYRTFHPYINESYDELDNCEDRLIAIVKEVERICNMSDDETTEWLRNVREITEFNFKKLQSTNSVTVTKRF